MAEKTPLSDEYPRFCHVPSQDTQISVTFKADIDKSNEVSLEIGSFSELETQLLTGATDKETHSTGTDSATESDSGVSKKSKVIVDDKTANNANISNQQNEVVNINETQIYLPEATPAVNISRQIETETQISILSSADYSDPANWPTHFSDNFRQFVRKSRPQQIEKYNFPRDRDEQKRKFSSIYYKRTLPNGEKVSRSWLIYSVSKNVVFCLCCKLFGRSKSSLPALEGSGLNDWKNIGALLSSHEKSNSHLVNFQMWKKLDIRLSTEKTIDHINQHKINEKEQYWQRILERS
ncbi:zinc finger MYM-type protein 5-like [Hydra vulgaris]|uniref:zinc finger MYM-type protein 5-like n=1 Tax=Hydra vulgaris TaxID=6087 RepID=UPI001F5F0FA8|nr:zinc finger MYM-type protein 5-like [Hydra vulgaris]